MLPIVDKKSGREKVAQGFHNAKEVCIYDSLSNSYEWMRAQEISKNPGDFSNELKRLGIKTVISCYMPPMALRIFARSGLNVYKARGNSVTENVRFFRKKQLEPFTSQATREMWGCSGSCGTCGTSCS